MGRSVSYPNGAVDAFRTLDVSEDEMDLAYECLVDEIVDTARIAFPSLEPCEGWRGREDRILLRNAFADCGISTYCGLAATWLAERDDNRYWEADYRCPRTGRARHWIAQGCAALRSAVWRTQDGRALFERRSDLRAHPILQLRDI